MTDRKIDKPDSANLPRKGRTPPTLELEWDEKGILQIDYGGDLERIALTAPNQHVLRGLFGQIAVLGSHGNQMDECASNFVLGFVDGMKPKDATETLLMAQMATIHQATMMMARRLNHVDTIQQQDSAERALNKLARTFASQMDTLKRYRSKGQQTVRVERVTIEPGAQAVVGNVNHGGRGDNET